MNDSKPKKLDFTRLVLSAVAICAVTAAMLYLYANPVQALLAKLEEIGKMDNMIWFVDHVPLFFSMAVPVALLMALYGNPKYYRPIYSQKEQFYISLVTMCFTYLVMLPYVIMISGPDVAENGAPIETLWDKTYEWFFMQLIPLILMTAYHSVRAHTEAEESEALAASNGEKGTEK